MKSLLTTINPLAFRTLSGHRFKYQQLRLNQTFAKIIAFEDYGKPREVLKLRQEPLPELSSKDLHVKFLAAPVNPADVNQIEGSYPAKPIFRPGIGAIGGNEGVAEVIAVGADVKGFKIGDWVIPSKPGFGTWRSHAAVQPEEIHRISKEGISVIQAATLTVNPCTAYRMLQDFVELKEGDYVVQNGGNSGVGQAVIQIAHARGIKTINIIQENFEEAAQKLKDLGATHVIADTNIRKQETRDLIKSIGRPIRLGLNCVGGKTTTDMSRLLGNNATLVTYGGMSREPLTFPTSIFIFKNLTATGFWMTSWSKEHSKEERAQMWDEILDMMRDGKLKEVPNEAISWGAGTECLPQDQEQDMLKKFTDVVDKALSGFSKGKQIVLF
ncbi:NAD(P)-binding protein [Basidiobolus meristosporus CBS 931.73]|uniref:enoyl-[acyl-carrier-protein] reductase n=1 Tax=Basidiobolus meristosporus CBS 931.73 TaxID=1314790 RepID=A0A1Y1XZM8_9FUNG|nr:NAD(P)-binding protein [Basidiobolus meristosporus CBS 931.73]|eukprot:ORX91168.1 NAD(P)-binding protein [Basidiobolus meristosporus CBS 931.73]